MQNSCHYLHTYTPIYIIHTYLDEIYAYITPNQLKRFVKQEKNNHNETKNFDKKIKEG